MRETASGLPSGSGAGVDPPSGPGGSERVPELDALRGLAALAIVVFHANPGRLPFGWAAVDLFFVLSGYLITGIILRHGATPGFLPRFYMRRGLRVWPVYYLVVLLLAVAVPVLPRPFLWKGLPLILTFTQGVPLYWAREASVFTWYLGHTWSLAIEEQFYLIWPAVLLLLRRKGVIPLAIGCAAASAIARGRGLDITLLGGRGDGLALGGLLAALLVRTGADRDARVRGRLASRFAAVAVLACLGILVIRGLAGPPPRPPAVPPWPGLTILAFNVLWFGLVGLTVCLSGSYLVAWMRHPALRGLGTVSYGLYLYHFPILLLSIDLAKRWNDTGRLSWREPLALGLCLAVAWLSWLVFERPILGWKERFRYRPGRQAGPRPTSAHPSHTIPVRHAHASPSASPQAAQPPPHAIDLD
jgi:peptidoglycan/LPS O-acetylase OafA/YrhL